MCGPVFGQTHDKLTQAVNAVDANVVFMRHALAPGFGDPENFDLRDCSTQRNLDQTGRDQAREIGKEIRNSETFFIEVLSSEWCRCQETTALLGLLDWTTFSGLNSFFQEHAEKKEVMDKLHQKLRTLSAGVVLMVTHQVVIRAATGQSVSSGEMIAYNTRTKETKKFRLD
jgi:broad specificity phosphatase PhoE